MKTTSLIKSATNGAAFIVAVYVLSCAILLPLFWPHSDSMTTFQRLLFRFAGFPSDGLGWASNAIAVVAINALFVGVAAFLVLGAALHIYHRRVLKDHVA
jgi:hypothetical protein